MGNEEFCANTTLRRAAALASLSIVDDDATIPRAEQSQVVGAGGSMFLGKKESQLLCYGFCVQERGKGYKFPISSADASTGQLTNIKATAARPSQPLATPARIVLICPNQVTYSSPISRDLDPLPP